MFEIMFFLFFLVFIGILAANVVSGVSEWNRNNNSPRLTVNAAVIAKRADISRHHHTNANGHSHPSTSTSYYVTFQVESGDRLELRMAGHEYGLLVEGDQGRLTFQGTRYLGFERQQTSSIHTL